MGVEGSGAPARYLRLCACHIAAFSAAVSFLAAGSVVATQLLTNKSDPNFLVPDSFVAAIPVAPLSPNTTYRVEFAGSTVQFPSGTVGAVSRTWAFTTAAQ